MRAALYAVFDLRVKCNAGFAYLSIAFALQQRTKGCEISPSIFAEGYFLNILWSWRGASGRKSSDSVPHGLNNYIDDKTFWNNRLRSWQHLPAEKFCGFATLKDKIHKIRFISQRIYNNTLKLLFITGFTTSLPFPTTQSFTWRITVYHWSVKYQWPHIPTSYPSFFPFPKINGLLLVERHSFPITFSCSWAVNVPYPSSQKQHLKGLCYEMKILFSGL